MPSNGSRYAPVAAVPSPESSAESAEGRCDAISSSERPCSKMSPSASPPNEMAELIVADAPRYSKGLQGLERVKKMHNFEKEIEVKC
jgi:hypothetical protein